MCQEAPVNYPGSQLRKETFVLEWEAIVQVFCNNGAQNGITEVFESFVVDYMPQFIDIGGRFVDKGNVVEFEFQRTVTRQFFNKRIKLFSWGRKEFYLVSQISDHVLIYFFEDNGTVVTAKTESIA